jgi:hypothetical protein
MTDEDSRDYLSEEAPLVIVITIKPDTVKLTHWLSKVKHKAHERL